MNLGRYVDTFNALGEESRIRLCMLLRERELCVSDLVRVTGMPQPRVSTHLGHLRNAGLVHDRRKGAQSFYTLATEGLPAAARGFLDEAAAAGDPTLDGDQTRLLELDSERRGAPAIDSIERDYSPGRTWQSLARGVAALLELGDVLDVGSGDGAAASELAPYCRSLTCIDTNARLIEAAKERLARLAHVRALVADVHALPFEAAS
ncbi:MAG: metalloregulator ArsR/SmtB family transcription factor, partial [Polyangia bacterium]